MVSVSRRRVLPQWGQATVSQSVACVSGDAPWPVNVTFSGSAIGRSEILTGTAPQASQYTMGIGVPQYRCRDRSQSRNLYVTVGPPRFFSLRNSATRFLAISMSSPSNPPELMRVPSASNGVIEAGAAPSRGRTA